MNWGDFFSRLEQVTEMRFGEVMPPLLSTLDMLLLLASSEIVATHGDGQLHFNKDGLLDEKFETSKVLQRYNLERHALALGYYAPIMVNTAESAVSHGKEESKIQAQASANISSGSKPVAVQTTATATTPAVPKTQVTTPRSISDTKRNASNISVGSVASSVTSNVASSGSALTIKASAESTANAAASRVVSSTKHRQHWSTLSFCKASWKNDVRQLSQCASNVPELSTLYCCVPQTTLCANPGGFCLDINDVTDFRTHMITKGDARQFTQHTRDLIRCFKRNQRFSELWTMAYRCAAARSQYAPLACPNIVYACVLRWTPEDIYYYIGVTSRNLRERWKEHLISAKDLNTQLRQHRAVHKMHKNLLCVDAMLGIVGTENACLLIIAKCSSAQDARAAEVQIQKRFNVLNDPYSLNLRIGC